MVANTFFKVCLRFYIVVMIAGIHISQEIFANDILAALKPSLEHDRKHVLRLLRLCRDQALDAGLYRYGFWSEIFYHHKVKIQL